MNPSLLTYIESLEQETGQIAEERKALLLDLSDFIRKKLLQKEPARLNFICTHNSRRSHLCQIWAATLAAYFGLETLETFSGGVEATAFNPSTVEAVRRAGFEVEDPGGENPRYKVSYDGEEDPLICYSKRFDDKKNPDRHFIAVMACSDADRKCPLVPGAEFRITLPFEDPKQADGTPQEAEVYDRRCRQIATELYYMYSQINR